MCVTNVSFVSLCLLLCIAIMLLDVKLNPDHLHDQHKIWDLNVCI